MLNLITEIFLSEIWLHCPKLRNIIHITKYLLDLWIYEGLIRSKPFPQEVYISVEDKLAPLVNK